MKNITLLILLFAFCCFSADLAKITYSTKSNVHVVTDRTKQGTAEDFNEIKTIVNANCTQTDSIKTYGLLKLAKVGSSINYSEIEADGTLKFNGTSTVYKDVVVPLLYKGGAGEASLDDLAGGIKNLQFDVNKYTNLENAEAPHDWKEGSEIELHLHWAVKTALSAGDKVRWEIETAFANANNGTNTGTIFCNLAAPTIFGTRKDTLEYVSPVGGTPAGTYLYSSLAVISAATMSNVKIGAGFIGTIKRIAKSAGGTEAANGKVFGLNLGIHYEIDTMGSRIRGVK